MKQVFLIRHGLPAFPGGRKMCLGATDIPLGQQGLAQAAQMAETLPPVTAVFSSPLIRAVQTAQAIGLPVAVLDDLRELSYGQWDGLTFEQIRKAFPAHYAARGLDPTLRIPGQEDPEDALARFSAAMDRAAALAPGDFAVVAHGGIIARFWQACTGTWYKPDYTEVLTLSYTGGTFYVKDPIVP